MTLSAALLIAVGALAPAVEVTDHAGRSHGFPDRTQAVLLIYEDQDAAKQNTAAKDRLAQINADPQRRARVDVIAIADLSKWDWWPARKYALADIRKIATENKTTVYIDWKGALRKAWGLARSKSTLILLEPDGKVRFVSEGPLTDAQWRHLLTLMAP